MNRSQQLVSQLSYTAAAQKQLQLSSVGFLTELDLIFSVTLSAPAPADLATFGLWRIIQSLRISGGTGKDYFNMSGVQMGVLAHFMNLVDYHDITTWHEVVATTQQCMFKIHFGSKPYDILGKRNPYDLSAAVPAMDETNLFLTWTCPPNTVMDDVITISSATLTVVEHAVMPDSSDVEAAVKANLFVPISSSEAYDPGATKSNLSGQRYVPTGNFVKRIWIAAQDETAVNAFGPLFVGDQVTALGIKLVKDNRWLLDNVPTIDLQLSNPKFDGMEVVDTPNVQSPFAPAGLYVIDFRRFDNNILGLDTRLYGSNDLILAMTIGSYAAGEVEQIFYEQYFKYGTK